ncbi:MAG: flagellar hook-basal body complex protein FliE [Saccharospirillum sp.]
MTDRMDIQNVLGQMRAIREQMQTNPAATERPSGPSAFAQQIQQAREAVQPSSQTPGVGGSAGLAEGQSVAPTGDVPAFSEMFRSAIDTVAENQSAASNLATRYEMGDPAVDLPEVMIALQKSSVSFQAMTQVRNKMVEAYQEIMRMPI